MVGMETKFIINGVDIEDGNDDVDDDVDDDGSSSLLSPTP